MCIFVPSLIQVAKGTSIDAVDRTLTEILGKAAARAIYEYLERRCRMRKEEIPARMEEFKRELQLILGQAAGIIIERIDEQRKEYAEREDNDQAT